MLSIDDEAIVTRGLSRMLGRRGFQIEGRDDPDRGIETLRARSHEFDLVLLDLNMPGRHGLEVLPEIRAIDPSLPVVVLTGDDSAASAVESMRHGAFTYLVKPLSDANEAALILANAVQFGKLNRRTRALERQLVRETGAIVGSSTSMRAVYRLIERVASTDACVLVRGESGTGKELVAQRLHQLSLRREAPFIALNCGAFAETMIDSELFGHERGAFTGAIRARSGAFVEAHGGTLLLDEIGDVPPAVQLRLLRVLQEREVRPVGGTGVRHVDVRVLAATNVDLEAAVETGRFRQDLYYRLNVVTIRLPSLRERRHDIPELIAHLLSKHCSDADPPTVSPLALERLLEHDWPGNIRELENAMQRALALAGSGMIDVAHLPAVIRGHNSPTYDDAPATSISDLSDLAWTDAHSFPEARKLAQQDFEREYIRRLLSKTDGNISEAARRAGLDRSNFRRVLSRLKIK